MVKVASVRKSGDPGKRVYFYGELVEGFVSDVWWALEKADGASGYLRYPKHYKTLKSLIGALRRRWKKFPDADFQEHPYGAFVEI